MPASLTTERHHGQVADTEPDPTPRDPASRPSVSYTLDDLEQADRVCPPAPHPLLPPVRSDRPTTPGGAVRSTHPTNWRGYGSSPPSSRGLGLDAVAKVLADPAGNRRSFSSLLEIRDELLEPWMTTATRSSPPTRCSSSCGQDARVLDELVGFGLIEPAGERYHVPSVVTLKLASQLMAAGVEPKSRPSPGRPCRPTPDPSPRTSLELSGSGRAMASPGRRPRWRSPPPSGSSVPWPCARCSSLRPRDRARPRGLRRRGDRAGVGVHQPLISGPQGAARR